MLKNRFAAAFAFVGLLGVAACGGGEEEVDPALEEPMIEEPAVAPTVTPAPAPMTTDTMMAPMDTSAAGATTTTTPGGN